MLNNICFFSEGKIYKNRFTKIKKHSIMRVPIIRNDAFGDSNEKDCFIYRY